MAKRKMLMDDIHEALRRNCELDTRFRRELTRLQLANQIDKLQGAGKYRELRFVPSGRRMRHA